MRLRYKGKFEEIDIAGFGAVKRGGEIELPDEIAEGIVRANPGGWQVVEASDGKPSSTEEE